MRNKIVLALVISLCGLLLGGSPTMAYPPGAPITATLSVDQIATKTGKTKLQVFNAKPNADVKVAYRGKTVTVQADESGLANLNLSGFPYGIFKIVITGAWSANPLETAGAPESTSVLLYVPKITVPKTAKIKLKSKIKLQYVKPGTAVLFLIKNKTKLRKRLTVKLGKKATSATATVPAKTFVKGKTNTTYVTVSKLLKLKFTTTGS